MMPPPKHVLERLVENELIDARTLAEFHEDEDLVDAVGEPVPGGVDELDDVRVSSQYSLLRY